MARIEGTKPLNLFQRFAYWMLKRMLGRVPEPTRIAAYSPPVFKARIEMERAMMKLTVDPALVTLAHIRTAQRIGCPF